MTFEIGSMKSLNTDQEEQVAPTAFDNIGWKFYLVSLLILLSLFPCPLGSSSPQKTMMILTPFVAG